MTHEEMSAYEESTQVTERTIREWKKNTEQLIAFEEREDELRRRRRAELISSGENPDVVPLPRRSWE